MTVVNFLNVFSIYKIFQFVKSMFLLSGIKFTFKVKVGLTELGFKLKACVTLD